MSTQHTPGPWKVSETGSDVEQDSEAAFGICALYADEASSANARLIAAAPELLDLLKRMKRHLDGGGSIQPENGVHIAIIAAIAKATVKEPCFIEGMEEWDIEI